ncbi:glycine zipper domain-containing protein [Ottowia sp.]|uniref:glycine zipper domain-containing protein n=1 Tax=Ottowia sp. TaxID=1898956 RepID=UPI003A8BE7C2
MTTKHTIEKIAETAETAADKTSAQVERTIDAARAHAEQVLDKADAKARTLSEDIKPAIDAISARMQDVAARGKTVAAETTAQAREKFHQVSDKTSTYVAEQPLKSMAIAAAAGAVVALLLGRRR